jgi:hypothetical protein
VPHPEAVARLSRAFHWIRDSSEVNPMGNMNRNTLYLIIGLLAAAIIIGAYLLYQERQKSSLTIEIGDSGVHGLHVAGGLDDTALREVLRELA